MDRIEKDASIFKKDNNFFGFVSLNGWCIPLNPEYGAAKACNIFINTFEFQLILLKNAHNVGVKGVAVGRRHFNELLGVTTSPFGLQGNSRTFHIQ